MNIDKDCCADIGAMLASQLATCIDDESSPEEKQCASDCCQHLAQALACKCGCDSELLQKVVDAVKEGCDDSEAHETLKSALSPDVVEHMEGEGAIDWAKLWGIFQTILPLLLPLIMKKGNKAKSSAKPAGKK